MKQMKKADESLKEIQGKLEKITKEVEDQKVRYDHNNQK